MNVFHSDLRKSRIKSGENACIRTCRCNIPNECTEKVLISDASAQISRRKDGSRHDQDPTGPPHGGKTGNEQQDRGGVPGTPGGNRNQRNQKERRVRNSWSGPPRKVQPE